MKTAIYTLIFMLLTLNFSCTPSLKKNKKEIVYHIKTKFILLPIEEDAQEVKMRAQITPTGFNESYDIRLAKNKVDYWIPLIVDKYKGKELKLTFSNAISSEHGINNIKESDHFEFEYNEVYRPQYHFSSKYGWMNDPNGMVYYNDTFHLFYQYNPYGNKWGNMNWGHAVSKDLIHWEHLPVAISPDELGYIFSGSAVIDKENTAGFGKDALIAVYTSAGKRQTQSIAYSLDSGYTFKKYKKNPVLTDPEINDFRDPKVFWHEDSNQWIMSLATSQTITFYGSKDLKEWKKLSEFGEGTGAHNGVWECPDLFTLKTSEGSTKWILLVSIGSGGPNGGSATQYFIGNFDGNTFQADHLPYPLWIDYGRDNYAGVTWNNVPDERRLFIGWMSNWEYANFVPTKNFRSAMTLPREFSLKSNGKHLILASNPVQETEKLRKGEVTFPTQRIEINESSIEKLLPDNKGTFELEMSIIPNGTSIFGFGFTNTKGDYLNFTFDHNLGKLFMDRRESGLIDFSNHFASQDEAPLLKKNEYKIRLFFDKASVELFVNEGEIVMTSLIFPREIFNRMTFFSPKANWIVKDIKIYPIK